MYLAESVSYLLQRTGKVRIVTQAKRDAVAKVEAGVGGPRRAAAPTFRPGMMLLGSMALARGAPCAA